MTNAPIGLNVVYLITKMDLAVIQRRSGGSYTVEIGVGRGGQKLKGKNLVGWGNLFVLLCHCEIYCGCFWKRKGICFLIDLTFFSIFKYIATYTCYVSIEG